MVKGQDTGSGVSKVETTAGVRQQSGFTFSAADNFQHTQNPHAHANAIRERHGPQGTHAIATVKNGPLDHKMAGNCVSLARTDTVSSTITN